MTTGYFDPITAKVWPRKPADYKNSEYDRKLEGYCSLLTAMAMQPPHLVISTGFTSF